MLRVFVDAADNDGAAIAVNERRNQGKAIFAIFQIDRIEQAFSLQPLQCQFHHLWVGGVDHDRCPHFARQELQQLRHVGRFVPVRVGHADVDHLCAPLNLVSGDLGSLLEALRYDHILELAGADDVGAFPHQHRPGIIFNH